MNSAFSHDFECCCKCDTCSSFCILSEIHSGQHSCGECLQKIEKALYEDLMDEYRKIVLCNFVCDLGCNRYCCLEKNHDGEHICLTHKFYKTEEEKRNLGKEIFKLL